MRILDRIRNLFRPKPEFHLVLAAERYAEGRPCDSCGKPMHIQKGVVLQWDNGSMTAKHVRCPS